MKQRLFATKKIKYSENEEDVFLNSFAPPSDYVDETELVYSTIDEKSDDLPSSLLSENINLSINPYYHMCLGSLHNIIEASYPFSQVFSNISDTDNVFGTMIAIDLSTNILSGVNVNISDIAPNYTTVLKEYLIPGIAEFLLLLAILIDSPTYVLNFTSNVNPSDNNSSCKNFVTIFLKLIHQVISTKIRENTRVTEQLTDAAVSQRLITIELKNSLLEELYPKKDIKQMPYWLDILLSITDSTLDINTKLYNTLQEILLNFTLSGNFLFNSMKYAFVYDFTDYDRSQILKQAFATIPNSNIDPSDDSINPPINDIYREQFFLSKELTDLNFQSQSQPQNVSDKTIEYIEFLLSHISNYKSNYKDYLTTEQDGNNRAFQYLGRAIEITLSEGKISFDEIISPQKKLSVDLFKEFTGEMVCFIHFIICARAFSTIIFNPPSSGSTTPSSGSTTPSIQFDSVGMSRDLYVKLVNLFMIFVRLIEWINGLFEYIINNDIDAHMIYFYMRAIAKAVEVFITVIVSEGKNLYDTDNRIDEYRMADILRRAVLLNTIKSLFSTGQLLTYDSYYMSYMREYYSHQQQSNNTSSGSSSSLNPDESIKFIDFDTSRVFSTQLQEIIGDISQRLSGYEWKYDSLSQILFSQIVNTTPCAAFDIRNFSDIMFSKMSTFDIKPISQTYIQNVSLLRETNQINSFNYTQQFNKIIEHMYKIRSTPDEDWFIAWNASVNYTLASGDSTTQDKIFNKLTKSQWLAFNIINKAKLNQYFFIDFTEIADIVSPSSEFAKRNIQKLMDISSEILSTYEKTIVSASAAPLTISAIMENLNIPAGIQNYYLRTLNVLTITDEYLASFSIFITMKWWLGYVHVNTRINMRNYPYYQSLLNEPMVKIPKEHTLESMSILGMADNLKNTKVIKNFLIIFDNITSIFDNMRRQKQLDSEYKLPNNMNFSDLFRLPALAYNFDWNGKTYTIDKLVDKISSMNTKYYATRHMDPFEINASFYEFFSQMFSSDASSNFSDKFVYKMADVGKLNNPKYYAKLSDNLAQDNTFATIQLKIDQFNQETDNDEQKIIATNICEILLKVYNSKLLLDKASNQQLNDFRQIISDYLSTDTSANVQSRRQSQPNNNPVAYQLVMSLILGVFSEEDENTPRTLKSFGKALEFISDKNRDRFLSEMFNTQDITDEISHFSHQVIDNYRIFLTNDFLKNLKTVIRRINSFDQTALANSDPADEYKLTQSALKNYIEHPNFSSLIDLGLFPSDYTHVIYYTCLFGLALISNMCIQTNSYLSEKYGIDLKSNHNDYTKLIALYNSTKIVPSEDILKVSPLLLQSFYVFYDSNPDNVSNSTKNVIPQYLNTFCSNTNLFVNFFNIGFVLSDSWKPSNVLSATPVNNNVDTIKQNFTELIEKMSQVYIEYIQQTQNFVLYTYFNKNQNLLNNDTKVFWLAAMYFCWYTIGYSAMTLQNFYAAVSILFDHSLYNIIIPFQQVQQTSSLNTLLKSVSEFNKTLGNIRSDIQNMLSENFKFLLEQQTFIDNYMKSKSVAQVKQLDKSMVNYMMAVLDTTDMRTIEQFKQQLLSQNTYIYDQKIPIGVVQEYLPPRLESVTIIDFFENFLKPTTKIVNDINHTINLNSTSNRAEYKNLLDTYLAQQKAELDLKFLNFYFVLIKCAISLHTAQSQMHFMHGNLQYSNVLVLPLSVAIPLTYTTLTQTYNVQSPHSPIIQNFDKSTMIVDGKILSSSKSNSTQYYNSMFDIVYLLTSINLVLQNSDVFTKIKNIIKPPSTVSSSSAKTPKTSTSKSTSSTVVNPLDALHTDLQSYNQPDIDTWLTNKLTLQKIEFYDKFLEIYNFANKKLNSNTLLDDSSKPFTSNNSSIPDPNTYCFDTILQWFTVKNAMANGVTMLGITIEEFIEKSLNNCLSLQQDISALATKEPIPYISFSPKMYGLTISKLDCANVSEHIPIRIPTELGISEFISDEYKIAVSNLEQNTQDFQKKLILFNQFYKTYVSVFSTSQQMGGVKQVLKKMAGTYIRKEYQSVLSSKYSPDAILKKYSKNPILTNCYQRMFLTFTDDKIIDRKEPLIRHLCETNETIKFIQKSSHESIKSLLDIFYAFIYILMILLARVINLEKNAFNTYSQELSKENKTLDEISLQQLPKTCTQYYQNFYTAYRILGSDIIANNAISFFTSKYSKDVSEILTNAEIYTKHDESKAQSKYNEYKTIKNHLFTLKKIYIYVCYISRHIIGDMDTSVIPQDFWEMLLTEQQFVIFSKPYPLLDKLFSTFASTRTINEKIVDQLAAFYGFNLFLP